MGTMVKCSECGKVCKPSNNGLFAGYATDKGGNKYCYECMAKKEEQTLQDLPIGRTVRNMYLVIRNGNLFVQNFTGLLSIPIYRIRVGRHNIAGIRYDFWFEFHGNKYYGVRLGDVECAMVKRIKGGVR